MNYYKVYIYIKGFGFDVYDVAANSAKHAKEVAKQRVLEETSMTVDDFEVRATKKLHTM